MASLTHIENNKNKNKNILEPFVGPRPFGLNKEDQERFFGRDDETEEIISLIYSHQLVLIYGESGTGKTSIFNGQIIPELERQGFEVFPKTRISIGSTNNNPKESFDATKEISNISNIYLFNAIQSILSKLPSRKNADGSIDGDSKSLDIPTISLSTFLKEYYPPKRNSRQKLSPQLLIFDQLEELFTFYPANWQKQQQEFFLQITEALNNNRLLRVVFVIREDFIAQLDPFKEIVPEKLRPRYRLERLSENAAISAIKKPLEKVIADPEIKEYYDEIHKIIEDLLKMRVETFGKNGRRTEEIKGIFIEPIYLQVVCQRWWRQRIANKNDQSKTNKSLQDFADVGKALEDFYEDVIHKATSKQTNVSEDTIREFCEKKLITSNETRSIVYQEEKSTEGLPNEIIEILDHKYLIRREIRSGGIWYELIHDRLIKPIKDSNRARRYKREKEQEKKLAEAQSKIIRWHHNLKIIIPMIIAFIIIISGSLIIAFYLGWLQPPHQSIIDICAKYPGNVPVGKNPLNLALNPNTNTLYVSNSGNSTVSVINCNGPPGKTIPSVNSINVGHSPIGIAVNPNTNMVYVTNHKDNTTSVINGSTNNAVYTIPVGHYPNSTSVNPNTNMVYVTNYNDNTISVINGSTNNVVKNIPVGHRPIGVAVNPTTNIVYVANSKSNTISVINGSTNNIVKNIPVSNPNSITVNPHTNRIYVGNSVDSKISVIYGGTNNALKNSTNNVMEIVVGNQIHKPVNGLAVNPKTNIVYVTIKGNPDISTINDITNQKIPKMIPAGNDPKGIAVNHNTNMVFVTDPVDDTVLMVNPSTTKNNPNEITVGTDPDGVAVNPNTNMVYVANRNDSTISVINGSTNNIVKNPSVDNIPEGIAVNPNTNMVYVTNLQSNTTSVIDGSTNNVVKNTIVGHNPIGIAVDPNTNMVYVANSKSNTISVINGSTNNAVRNIIVGHNPNRIAVNPNTNMVYVTNSKSNTISVIDGHTNNVTKTITVGHRPIGVAVDPNTNMVYVTNYNDNTISVIDGHTNNVTKTIIVGKNPNSIAVDPNTNMAYVTNYNDKTVSLIDEHNNNVIINKNDNISKIKTSYPNGIAVDPKTNMVYIIDQGSNILLTIKVSKENTTSVIDGSTGKVVKTIPVDH